MPDLYVVLVVSAISWAGIFFYLLRLDLRLRKMERRYEK
jgi:CcmD family protein